MSTPESSTVDISSSEEDDLVCVSSKKRSALDEYEDEVVIIDKTEFLSFSSRRQRKKRSQILETTAMDDEDGDCCVLASPPSAAPTDQLAVTTTDNVDELVVTGETGPVACRDFPHARYLCAQFPFKTTDPVNCCKQCHCYVCDILAPCDYWVAHCRANDKDEFWKNMRKARKNSVQSTAKPGPPTLLPAPFVQSTARSRPPALPPVQANVQVNVSSVQSNARFRSPPPVQSNVRPHGQQQQQWTMADYALGRAVGTGRAIQRPSGSGYLKVWTNERLPPGSQPPTTGPGRPKKHYTYTNSLAQIHSVQSVPSPQAAQVNQQVPRHCATGPGRLQPVQARVSNGHTGPSEVLRPVAVASNLKQPLTRVAYRRVVVTPSRKTLERTASVSQTTVGRQQQQVLQTPRTQAGEASTRIQTGEASTRTQAGEASTRIQTGEASTRIQNGEAATRTQAGEALTGSQASEGHPKKARSAVRNPSSSRQLRSGQRTSKQDGARVRNSSANDLPSQHDQAGCDQLTGRVPVFRHQDSAPRNQRDNGAETGRSEGNSTDVNVRQCNSGSTSKEQVNTMVPWALTAPDSSAALAASQVCAYGASGNDLAGPNHEQCYTNMQTGEMQVGITEFEYLTELEALLELGTPTSVQ